MKFLVDNQLPAALARFLTSRGQDALHVLDLKMDELDDNHIWNYAAAEGRAIVSKDEDFLHLANREGDSGVFVWVRIGNCRKQALITAFDRTLSDLISALEAGHRVVEVR